MEHASRPRRLRVLCVDDSADTREVIRDLLELEGYEVSEADCAHAALRRLRSERFDLLVTDQMMPDETGAWLVAEARSQGLLDRTRVVMVTANQPPTRRELTADVPVFRKPLDPDRFLDALCLLTGRRPGGEGAPA